MISFHGAFEMYYECTENSPTAMTVIWKLKLRSGEVQWLLVVAFPGI
jgi:hypothetical protein